jgi:hypothetical protein
MKAVSRRCDIVLLMLGLLGCSGSPSAFEAPGVDVASAAERAMELYDADKDGTLNEPELAKCPGLLLKRAGYAADGDSALQQAEIEAGLGKLFKHGTGGTQLNCLVLYKGRPLAGAEVVLDPEPYLGEEVQTAKGTTNGSGATQLGIPSEYLPSHLERLKAVHYGTFKVRITHPTIAIPAKYNTETELGYETEPGNPTTTFVME